MALISIFLRPILALDAHVTVEPVAATVFRDVVVSRPVWGLGGARGGEERTMTRQAALVSETPAGTRAGDVGVFCFNGVAAVDVSCLLQKAK